MNYLTAEVVWFSSAETQVCIDTFTVLSRRGSYSAGKQSVQIKLFSSVTTQLCCCFDTEMNIKKLTVEMICDVLKIKHIWILE